MTEALSSFSARFAHGKVQTLFSNLLLLGLGTRRPCRKWPPRSSCASCCSSTCRSPDCASNVAWTHLASEAVILAQKHYRHTRHALVANRRRRCVLGPCPTAFVSRK